MFGSTSLEVATGLVFVFLLLSVLVTAAGELVSAVFNARAKTLWKGIAALLEDSATQGAIGQSWTARLYEHPILRPLFPLPAQGNEEVLGPKGKGPSYIPSRSFAIALLDITGVTNPAVNQWQHQLEALLAGLPADGEAETVRQAVQHVADAIGGALDGQQLKADLEDLAARVTGSGAPNAGRIATIAGQIKGETLGPVKAMLVELSKHPDADVLQSIIQQVPTAGAEAAVVRNGLLALLPRLATGSVALATAKGFAQGISTRWARRALAELENKNKDLHGALVTLLDEAHGDVDKLKDHVETWFNHSMERVKGWYKRKTIVVHLIIAAVLTVFMNVDALVVMRHLSADPALRTSLLAQADGYVKKATATPVATPALAATPSTLPRLTVAGSAGDADANAAAGTPVGSNAAGAGKTTADGEDVASIQQAEAGYQKVQTQLLGLGLPIGWSLPAPEEKPAPAAEPAGSDAKAKSPPPATKPATRLAANEDPEFRTLPGWEWEKLARTLQFHSIGWLLSIIAATLGAPFWFDILQKFINIRATGRPPETPPGRSNPPAKPAA